MKIFTIIVNRANYARLFPLLDEIEYDKNIENFLILTGTCIEKEYGTYTFTSWPKLFNAMDML